MTEIIIIICLLIIALLSIVNYKKQNRINELELNRTILDKKLIESEALCDYIKQLLLIQLQELQKDAQKNLLPVRPGDKKINQPKFNWTKLYPIFDGLYDKLAEKLAQRYPTLTEKEKQHCCLIRAKFRTDEITYILDYETTTSTHTQKNKLQKKLGIADVKEWPIFFDNL